MDQILSQGTQLISSTCTIVNNLDAVRVEVDRTIKVFSQELETQEKDFEAWLKFEDYDILMTSSKILSFLDDSCTLISERPWNTE